MSVDAKCFEIRDRGTFIPVLAVRLPSGTDQEQWLQRRCGWCNNHYVILTNLQTSVTRHSPHEWDYTYGSTLVLAHNHMLDHWDELQDGQVIDVEFLRGEREAPRTSEREESEQWQAASSVSSFDGGPARLDQIDYLPPEQDKP